MKILVLVFLMASVSHAKEIAFTFDDAPGGATAYFLSRERTDWLLGALKKAKVPPVLIFANPCNGDGAASNLSQLQKFKDAGNLIANHTCTHPRLDKVGPQDFFADTLKAENILASLMLEAKYFRFPFFNEGSDVLARDQVREWLSAHKYQNVSSSVENEDPIFSAKINEAKQQNKKIDIEKVKALYLKHILEGAEFYDKLALEILGRSPKHIILLHDKDATVLFIGELVAELRKRGWSIIGVDEAVKDPLYFMRPKNTHSSFGILAQMAFEKRGSFQPYYDFQLLVEQLNSALNLKASK